MVFLKSCKLELKMFRSKQPLRSSSVVLLGLLLFVSGCHSSQTRKQEQLNEALFAMRSAIDQFLTDKDRSPKSLQELISVGYMKQVPVDPLTGSDKTWLCLIDDEDDSGDVGIVDIASGSESPDSGEGSYTKCP